MSEAKKALIDVIKNHDLKSKNKTIEKILMVAWDNNYNLGQIETVKFFLETEKNKDIKDMIQKYDHNYLEIISDILRGDIR